MDYGHIYHLGPAKFQRPQRLPSLTTGLYLLVGSIRPAAHEGSCYSGPKEPQQWKDALSYQSGRYRDRWLIISCSRSIWKHEAEDTCTTQKWNNVQNSNYSYRGRKRSRMNKLAYVSHPNLCRCDTQVHSWVCLHTHWLILSLFFFLLAFFYIASYHSLEVDKHFKAYRTHFEQCLFFPISFFLPSAHLWTLFDFNLFACFMFIHICDFMSMIELHILS